MQILIAHYVIYLVTRQKIAPDMLTAQDTINYTPNFRKVVQLEIFQKRNRPTTTTTTTSTKMQRNKISPAPLQRNAPLLTTLRNEKKLEVLRRKHLPMLLKKILLSSIHVNIE
jgi:hypothetical protein